MDLSRFAELEREISRNWLDMAYFWCYFMNNSASMQKGRAEGMQQVALNMLQKKADISFISEVTGLTEKEIKKLKK